MLDVFVLFWPTSTAFLASCIFTVRRWFGGGGGGGCGGGFRRVITLV